MELLNVKNQKIKKKERQQLYFCWIIKDGPDRQLRGNRIYGKGPKTSKNNEMRLLFREINLYMHKHTNKNTGDRLQTTNYFKTHNNNRT